MLPVSYNYIIDYCELCDDKENDVYIVTNCNHVFHKRCMCIYLKKKRKCPICAKSVTRVNESFTYFDCLCC